MSHVLEVDYWCILYHRTSPLRAEAVRSLEALFGTYPDVKRSAEDGRKKQSYSPKGV